MNRNLIIGIVVVVILIFGGLIGWIVMQKGKIPPSQVTPQPQEKVFSLSGSIISIDAANNSLIVRRMDKEEEVKIIISDTTKLIKLGIPKNAPKQGSFTPTQTAIKISDFKVKDSIFVKSSTNIAGKNEIDDVELIQILP